MPPTATTTDRTPRTLPDGREACFRELSFELRENQGSKLPTIVGYAAKFNVSTDIGDVKRWGFREVIRPGAFTRTIVEDDIRALFNHNTDNIVGRKSSGTLRLQEDVVGLRYEIDPPDTSAGRDLVESIRRKDIRGSSFLFVVRRQTWGQDPTDENIDLRELLDVQVFELGPVTFPQYEETEAGIRSRRDAGRDENPKLGLDRETNLCRIKLAEAEAAAASH